MAIPVQYIDVSTMCRRGDVFQDTSIIVVNAYQLEGVYCCMCNEGFAY
jgi:hypothetical protein